MVVTEKANQKIRPASRKGAAKRGERSNFHSDDHTILDLLHIFIYPYLYLHADHKKIEGSIRSIVVKSRDHSSTLSSPSNTRRRVTLQCSIRLIVRLQTCERAGVWQLSFVASLFRGPLWE